MLLAAELPDPCMLCSRLALLIPNLELQVVPVWDARLRV